jgi:hypothetical protein
MTLLVAFLAVVVAICVLVRWTLIHAHTVIHDMLAYLGLRGAGTGEGKGINSTKLQSKKTDGA